MKCLECKYATVEEYGCSGRIGESIITCLLCNKIKNDNGCDDFKPNGEGDKN